jgi:hypothetical protein
VRRASRQYVWTIRDIAVPLRTSALYSALGRFQGSFALASAAPRTCALPSALSLRGVTAAWCEAIGSDGGCLKESWPGIGAAEQHEERGRVDSG